MSATFCKKQSVKIVVDFITKLWNHVVKTVLPCDVANMFWEIWFKLIKRFQSCLHKHAGADLGFFVVVAKYCRAPWLADDTFFPLRSPETHKNQIIYGKLGDNITSLEFHRDNCMFLRLYQSQWWLHHLISVVKEVCYWKLPLIVGWIYYCDL